MVKLLHFADAHIDIAIQGRHDPQTGLAVRTLDFLKSLDTIVDAAINEKVDLVLFAGDAYKDRTPVPTFQREWGRRIMRLSQAGIPTLLLVGNHDLSPASGRAHALQEYETLSIPHVRVASKPQMLTPDDLDGVPLQILALPWVSRSLLIADLEVGKRDFKDVKELIEEVIAKKLNSWYEKLNPFIPTILTAHASIEGAIYGGERSVMLDNDMVLPGSFVYDTRLDYVALGHIHKPQDLNKGGHHPVIYPGSIERVNFGEVDDEKFYIIAEVEKNGQTKVKWCKLNGRRFIDKYVKISPGDEIMECIFSKLPNKEVIRDTILRLVIEYPSDYEKLIEEQSIRLYAEDCLEFHLVRRPQRETRLRLPQDQTISSLTPLELLDKYWKTVSVNKNMDKTEIEELLKLASELFSSANNKDYIKD